MWGNAFETTWIGDKRARFSVLIEWLCWHQSQVTLCCRFVLEVLSSASCFSDLTKRWSDFVNLTFTIRCVGWKIKVQLEDDLIFHYFSSKKKTKNNNKQTNKRPMQFFLFSLAFVCGFFWFMITYSGFLCYCPGICFTHCTYLCLFVVLKEI